ncbi:MAG: ComEC/Rec2 family competence protein, partial [Myxococcota bacterium]
LLLVGFDEGTTRDVGFWLSVTSVAALVGSGSASVPHSTRWGGLLEGVLAPAIATAPICATAFRSVAIAGPLANLFALPLATFVLTPAALLSCVFIATVDEPLGLASLVELSVTVLDHSARLLANVHWSVPSSSAPVVVVLTALAVGSAFARGRRRHVMRLFVLLALCAPSISLDRSLVITHIAVGQGDATLVQFPNGAAWLIDGGGRVGPGRFDPGREHVVPALLDSKVRELDAIVATHGDADHVRGLHAVLDHVPVDRLYWNGRSPPSSEMQSVLEHAERLSVELIAVEEEFLLREGRATIRLRGAPGHDSENESSVVAEVRLGAFRAMFAGDIGEAREFELASNLEPVDLLLAPHHGSRSSTSLEWLEALRPRAVVISVGRRNHYRMPHPVVLERLRNAAIPVFRMDEVGQVRVKSTGSGFVLESQNGGSLDCLRECVPRLGSLRR